MKQCKGDFQVAGYGFALPISPLRMKSDAGPTPRHYNKNKRNEQHTIRGDMTTTAVTAAVDFRAALDQAQEKLRGVAPQYLNLNRVMRLILAAQSRNPLLEKCTMDSVLLFFMRCAETGMEPIGAGGAWAVPFKNNKTGKYEMQFIPDWRGLIQSAKRTEQIKHAYATIVCKGDTIEYQLGDNPSIMHKPLLTDRGEMIGAYCIVTLPDDTKHIEYMELKQLEAVRSRSKAKDGPWKSDLEQMSCKTVVKRALKPFMGSPELQAAVEYDNAATGMDLPDRAPIALPHSTEDATETPLGEQIDGGGETDGGGDDLPI